MFAIGRADGVRLVILKDHSGVGSGSLLDLLRLLHCFCLDGVEIDVFTIKSGNFIGIEILVLIVSRFAVHIQLGNDLVGLLFPVRVQVRPAVDGLAGDVHVLAFAAPEGEGVALAGRGGRVCGGQSRANAGLGGTEDALLLGVVVLICRQRFQRIKVNDRNHLCDDELEILPVAIDLQLGQRGGFVRLFAVHIVRILVEPAVVVPAAVDLEVEIEIAARIDLRKVNRFASKLIGGVRNIHDRLAQIAGLEDHEVDVGRLDFLMLDLDGLVGVAAVFQAAVAFRRIPRVAVVIKVDTPAEVAVLRPALGMRLFGVRAVEVDEAVGLNPEVRGEGSGSSETGNLDIVRGNGINLLLFRASLIHALDVDRDAQFSNLFRSGKLDPLCGVGCILVDSPCNFGLPACEGVAFTVRGAVERGGHGILPKVRIDLIGEHFLAVNAVGVGDGEGFGDSFADRVENNTVPADLVIVHSPFLRFFVPEQRHGLGIIGRGMLAVLIR